MKKILIVLCCAMLLAFGLFEIRFVETAEENQSREREFAQETGDSETRVVQVYTLKNAKAASVAEAINNYQKAKQKILSQSQDDTTLLQLEEEFIIVAEEKTNSLVIEAKPRYLEEILKMLDDLDREQTETQRYVDKMIRQTTCETRMKQIVTALFGYHQKYDCFPEAFTTDKDGKPLQSWRVAILPFLGEKELYEKIRKEEPWNSEYNRQFHARCPRLFQCPDAIIVHPEMAAKGLTTYALIVGETAYPEGGRFSLDREHFLDGTANTWAITERAAPACWMDPKGNIPQEEAEKGIGGSPSGIGIYHDGFALYHESTHDQQGVHASFFSGDVKFFARNLAKDVIKAVITPRGGEAIFIYQYDDP